MNGWTKDDVERVVRKNRTTCKESLQVGGYNRSIGCILGGRVLAKGNRGTFHKSGEMNKTEAAYAGYLDSLKKDCIIADYRFEAVKLRLADNTFYTPDFMVLMPDFSFEMHEVKGFWEDDARVKIKVAAAQFPFKFVAVKKTKNGWVREVF